MSDVGMAKKALREKMLSIRSAVSSKEKDKAIIKSMESFLAESPEITEVFLYHAIRSEPNIFTLQTSDKMTTALPKIVSEETGEMEFVEWSLGKTVGKNSLGISEPVSDAVVVADSSTLILVPCLAVGIHGERLGYGGGYYDRYFARCPLALRIGVIYGELLLEQIPQEENDIRMQGYVTEEKLVLL